MSEAPPTEHPPRLGFGLTARPTSRLDVLAGLAVAIERLGYDELWANDGPSASGLATLAAAATGADRIRLGVGVAPLSERKPEEIAAEVARLGLPPDRLVLGVGSGRGASLALVHDGVVALRRLLPSAEIAVAAVGPRMCSLAGRIADVVLLNWAFPDRIGWSRRLVAEGAAAAERQPPRVAGYVRVAIGPGARGRLLDEAERYRGRHSAYRRHFEAQDALADRVPGVAEEDPARVADRLAPYRAALDSCVVRALPAGDDADELLAIAAAARGLAARR